MHTADLPVQAHPDRLMPALAAVAPPPAPARGRAARGGARRLARRASPRRRSPATLDMGEVVRHLAAVLPPDAILTNGAGNFATWTNKHLPFTGGMRLLGPQSGAMGYGVPAAIAAKLARPGAPASSASTGDGDFQMTMQELGCAMQAGAAPIVLLVNNRSYGTIRMHQERTYPGPRQLHRHRQPRLRRDRPRLRHARRAGQPQPRTSPTPSNVRR